MRRARVVVIRHAVRRFVFENHGLMKRMYGEQRHISVLRADMDTNDIEGGAWNRRREESSLNRYDSRPPPSPPPTGTATASAGTASTINTTTAAAPTVRPVVNNVTEAVPVEVDPVAVTTIATVAGDEDAAAGEADEPGDGTDASTTDDDTLPETTTEPVSSTQRAEQVEQPGSFKEPTATATTAATTTTTENPPKSKGM